MEFEVVNDKGKTIHRTSHACCIPNKKHINLMMKAGYKIKVDGKNITKKKLDEIIANLKESD